MSRCVLDNEETGCEVAIGWDTGLDTFFAQVIQSSEDSPSIWLGTMPGEYATPDEPIMAILPWACKFDQMLLRDNLMQDKEIGDERLYAIEGSQVFL